MSSLQGFFLVDMACTVVFSRLTTETLAKRSFM